MNCSNLTTCFINVMKYDIYNYLVIVTLMQHVDGRLVLQVTTLVEHIQQLRSMKFTCCIHDTFTRWADASSRVDTCRRDEIANAINRHRTKITSQMEKDKGFSFVFS